MGCVVMGSDGVVIVVDLILIFGIYFVLQGILVDIIVIEYGFICEDVDKLVVESQCCVVFVWLENCFVKFIVFVLDQNGLIILDYDEYMCFGIFYEDFVCLKFSFKEMGEMMLGFDKVVMLKYLYLDYIDYIYYVGNSLGIVDGVVVVLIGNVEFGKVYGFKFCVWICVIVKIGMDLIIMLIGLVLVIEKILCDSGMFIGDIDLFEVNEVFVSVVLCFQQVFQIDLVLVNVNGGLIVMGYLLGVMGVIIIGILLDEFEWQDKNVGLVMLCIVFGMGVVIIIECV